MTKKANYVLYRDVKLTRQSRSIFGSSVKDAYTAKPNFEFESEEEKLNDLKRDAVNAVDGKEISLDAKTIVIRFDNGNLLKFDSSEWGAISKFKETFEEIKE